MANRNFQRAKANKNDEFYTQLSDNEKPYEIIDGQQQLTLISNKKLESLKLEFEVKESEKQIDEGIDKC